MAKLTPLQRVFTLAREAEDKAAMVVKTVSLSCEQSKQQLQVLQNYRLDYLQQVADQQGQVVSANHFQQFHRFIAQLDDAIARQLQARQHLENNKLRAQQSWNEKHQKTRAIELLLEQKAQQQQKKVLRAEQKLSDEFTQQQFYRRKLAGS